MFNTMMVRWREREVCSAIGPTRSIKNSARLCEPLCLADVAARSYRGEP